MEGYLTLSEAAERLAVSRQTIWRLVKGGELQTFRSPVNRRATLVRVQDLDRLRAPQPIERNSTKREDGDG